MFYKGFKIEIYSFINNGTNLHGIKIGLTYYAVILYIDEDGKTRSEIDSDTYTSGGLSPWNKSLVKAKKLIDSSPNLKNISKKLTKCN
jgi:hypothetical protein